MVKSAMGHVRAFLLLSCRCSAIQFRPSGLQMRKAAFIAMQATARRAPTYFEQMSVAKLKLLPNTSRAALHNDASHSSMVEFEEISNATLDAFAEYLESLADEGICPEEFDVQLASGVLTVKMGGDVGTYVINKQTPNRQIWLSSPISGPKRYDLINNRWMYSHDGIEINELLAKEFSKIFQRTINPSDLRYDVDDP